MQTATIAEKPRKQAISGRFWAGRTYRGRIKDDHKIDTSCGTGGFVVTAMTHVIDQIERSFAAELGVEKKDWDADTIRAFQDIRSTSQASC